jgi:hypothetical protein
VFSALQFCKILIWSWVISLLFLLSPFLVPFIEAKNDLDGDLFGFDDTQSEGLNNNTQKNKLLASLKVLKENNQPLESSKEQAKNLKELSESAKDFKRNNINKTGKTQEYFNFSKNIDTTVVNTINGTKKGLSKNKREISSKPNKSPSRSFLALFIGDFFLPLNHFITLLLT